MTQTEEDLGPLYRASLATFVERVFMHLYPGTPFLPNWHIDLIAAKLEQVFAGKIKRLIINVPPRSLKSIMTSVGFVAWALGNRPDLQFICASYGQDLADKHAEDCRNVMTSDWYRRAFPARLRGARPAVSDLKTTAGGGRIATSVGGVLTGLGGDIILVDDPLKPDEALSDAARNGANGWIANTVMSRFNNKKTGAMIIIMQRLHLDDLVGHVQEHGDWQMLSLQAIAEADEVHEFETLLGPQRVIRRAGEALHPERESLAILAGLRQTLGEYNFAGQYQQTPVPLGGGMVKDHWLQYVDPHEVPEKFDQVVQSWDTANKQSELADYSVCTTWGLKGKDEYLIHVYRERLDYPCLKRAVIDLQKQFNANVVLIEDKASGTQLIQELQQLGMHRIKQIKPEGNKIMRMHAQTAAFDSGFVKLPRKAPWLDAYVVELTSFPNAKYDDQVDSTSQALAWIVENGNEPGIMAYYRHEVEKMRRGGG